MESMSIETIMSKITKEINNDEIQAAINEAKTKLLSEKPEIEFFIELGLITQCGRLLEDWFNLNGTREYSKYIFLAEQVVAVIKRAVELKPESGASINKSVIHNLINISKNNTPASFLEKIVALLSNLLCQPQIEPNERTEILSMFAIIVKHNEP